MVVSRRSFAAGAGALAISGLAGRRAHGAEFTYRYANNLPPQHPTNLRAAEAAGKIREESGGRFVLEIFPAGQLGSDPDMLNQIRSGAVDFFTLSGQILSTFVPLASINSVGFAFSDYGSIWTAMDGMLGEEIRRGITRSRTLLAMDKIWDNGFRHITSSTKPITTPGDLANFKIRVPASPISISMFKALGAAPTTINFNETYIALQSKIVDGQENPLAVISAVQLYEVQRYCSLTNHMWDGLWFLANRRRWEALPETLREIVARNINAAALAQRADIDHLTRTLQAELSAKGISFNTVDPAPFRERLKSCGFYSAWKARYGNAAWADLEGSVGALF